MKSLARQSPTCAAPATVKRTSFHKLRFCQLATERLEQAFGKATKVVSVSPDTGQQGGSASKTHCLFVHALSGKAVRANSVGFLVKKTIFTCFCLPVFCLTTIPELLAQQADQEIVITATRSAQKLSDTISDITVISRQAIEASSHTSVTELLATQPGIQTVTHGANSVFIRGAEARMTSVYIDGVRADSQDGNLRLGGGMPWELMPLDAIERIEILKGPASAVYGSDPMGGVIQIFTRQSNMGKRVFVSASYGTYSTSKFSTGMSGKKDSVDYSLNVSQENSAGFNTYPGVIHTPGKEPSHNVGLNARLGMQMSDLQRLEMIVIQNKLTSKFVDVYNSNGYVDYNSSARLSSSAVRWLSDWSADYQTKISFAQSEHEVTDNQPNRYKTITESTLFENIYKFSEGVLTGAIESKSDKLNQPVSAYGTAFSGGRNQYAWSVGFGNTSGDHSYQLNMRHDQDALFGSKNTSAIAYGLKLSQKLKATASISSGFRSPTLDQIYSSLGSLTLKPETSKNQDIGLQYSTQDSYFKAVIYRNEFKNLISSMPVTFVYYNVNMATLKGLTFSGNQKIGSFQFRGSYDLLNAKDGENRALNLRAQHSATFGVDKNMNAWKFGAEWIGIGHRFDNAANTKPLAAYALVNAVTSYQINSDYKAFLRFNNLADKKYQQISGYATPGRNLFIGLNWQPK